MTTSISEENGPAQATTADEKPKPTKKARVAPRRAHVAPKKAKSARKASPAKKAPKGRKKPEAARYAALAVFLGLLAAFGCDWALRFAAQYAFMRSACFFL